jgi:cobaltochelatase CobN
LSVDTYIQRTLTGAKAILIRLIGGVAYWPYGLQQIELLARNQGIALAVLPGDGRPDDRLAQASTLPPPYCTIWRLCVMRAGRMGPMLL